MKFYHFTCDHGAEGIRRDGELRPQSPWPVFAMGVATRLEHARPVVWLTDDPAPDRAAVGLTSVTLNCDRMAHRFEVDARVWRWADWAAVRGANPEYLMVLGWGREPWRWFVSEKPLPVLAEVVA